MPATRIRPTITLGTQERFIYTHTGSGFAEDSWQLTPKLNLNLGLRYDYQQPFYTNDPNLSIFDPTSTTGLVVASGGSGTPEYIYNSNKVDLSPRVGLSYQIHNRTVLRANYGIYYDQPAGQAFFGNIGIPNQGAGGVNNNPVGSQPNESIVLTPRPRRPSGRTTRQRLSSRPPRVSPRAATWSPSTRSAATSKHPTPSSSV